MKFSSLPVRIFTILGSGRRGRFLTEATISEIWGCREDGKSFRIQQSNNELELMDLEGLRKKASKKFLLDRRGNKDEEGVGGQKQYYCDGGE